MKKILVLDDNQDILDVVTEALAYEQFEVHGTDSAQGLIHLAEVFQPDLVLLDLRLVDGHGGELCREMKQNPLLCHIPVIIFTAYSHPQQNITDFGCDALVAKPFDLSELLTKINELIYT